MKEYVLDKKDYNVYKDIYKDIAIKLEAIEIGI